MKKIIALAIAACMLFISTAAAQEGTVIEYGQIVNGEISDQEFEVSYSFEGTADDIIVIEMQAVDVLGDLNSPLLLLLDANGRVLTDSSGTLSLGDAILVAQLPENGNYTIIATRSDGRAGDSVGDFTLELISVPILNIGAPVSTTANSENRSDYYAVLNEGTPLSLSYVKQAGQYSPQITINEIGSDGELTELVSMFGNALERGEINVPSGRGLYIVTVGSALFDFHFREVTADYELVLVASE